jgi:signal peptidase I
VNPDEPRSGSLSASERTDDARGRASVPTDRPSPVEQPTPVDRRARRRRLIIEYAVIAIVAVLVAVLVQAYVVKPYRIPSESMENTLMPGDRVFVNRFIYHFTSVDRGNIVVFKSPSDGTVLIKRVIGLPGNVISLKDGAVYIDGKKLDEPYVRTQAGAPEPSEPFDNGEPWDLQKPYTVPANNYFMMGDNRTNSGDSREFGPVSKNALIGEAFFIYWPLNRIGTI